MEPPLLRVSRPISACSRCRGAKIKCDGKLPACSACERSNCSAECSSANDRFAKGRERSYVASLESRVERLQKEISQIKERSSSATMTDMRNASSSASHAQRAGSVQIKRRKEVSDVDELVSDFGFLSVNATARDFHGFTNEMSFARLVLSTSSVDKIPRFLDNELPHRETATALIQQYLSSISALYPILTKTALFGSLDAVYQSQGRRARAVDYWNLHMTLAIALASQSRSQDDAKNREAVGHVGSALEYIEYVVQPGSAAGVQAILLLLLYSLVDPRHFKSWYLIGMASRSVVDLGLHQDPREEPRIDEPQLDLRHQIYLVVYSLDRTISMANTRAFSFSDDSTNVKLSLVSHASPSSTEPPQTSKIGVPSSEPSLLLFQLRKLLSGWYQSLLYSNPSALVEPWLSRCEALVNMQEWCSHLPISLPLQHLFRSEILYSSILLIWPQGSLASVCPYGRALVFQYAIDYADTTWKMLTFSNATFCTSLDILRAFFVGQRLLGTVQKDSPIFHRAPPQLPPIRHDMVQPPSLIERDPAASIENAIQSIQLLSQILRLLGQKFGYSTAHSKFESESVSVLEILFDRRNTQAAPTTE